MKIIFLLLLCFGELKVEFFTEKRVESGFRNLKVGLGTEQQKIQTCDERILRERNIEMLEQIIDLEERKRECQR